MILTRIEVTDFLSIKGTLGIDIDKKVTIFLGSNDHGKSNILRAIQHLNDDDRISEEEANWDAEDGDNWDPARSPSISYFFALTPAERREWKHAVEQTIQQTANRAAEALLDSAKEETDNEDDEEQEDDEEPTPLIRVNRLVSGAETTLRGASTNIKTVAPGKAAEERRSRRTGGRGRGGAASEY